MQDIRDAVHTGAHAQAVVAIASYNADINALNGIWGGHMHILTFAVVRDSIPAIEALAARRDIDLEAPTRGKIHDPVLMAAGRPATLRALLRCFPGINLNVRIAGYISKSALAHAAFFGYMESVQLLLDAGADPLLYAPHEEARVRGYETIAALIEEHAAWANGLRCAWTHAVVDILVSGVLCL